MASEEVKKILDNLETLKGTRLGSGEDEDKTEIEKLQEDLEAEMNSVDEVPVPVQASVQAPVAPVQAPVAPVPVQAPVAPVQAPVAPVPVQAPVAPVQEPKQIIQAEIEALNNDGLYRHSLLERLSNIEQHLHMLAVANIKIAGIDLDGKKIENVPRV